jgi:hypothetical protein
MAGTERFHQQFDLGIRQSIQSRSGHFGKASDRATPMLGDGHSHRLGVPQGCPMITASTRRSGKPITLD